jgi:hypothetical protein
MGAMRTFHNHLRSFRVQPAGLGFVIDVFIFYLLELVKIISVHRAHRLLSEAALILCMWRNRLSVTVSGFDRLLSAHS